MPNWVTVRPPVENYDQSSGGGRWKTIKPARVETAPVVAPVASVPFGQKVKNFFTENSRESIYDTFFQKKADQDKLKNIQENNNVIKILAQRNENEIDENARRKREVAISNLMKVNETLSGQAGGAIKNKTNLQLVGQSLGTAAELTPFLGFSSAGTQAVKAGVGALGKKVGSEVIMSAAQPLTRNITREAMGEGALFGGVVGFGEAAKEEDATLWSLAKGTAIGGGAGAVFGGVLSKVIGKIAGRVQKAIDAREVKETIESIEVDFDRSLTPQEETGVMEALSLGVKKEDIVKEVTGTSLDAKNATKEPPKPKNDTEVPKPEDDAFLKAVEARFNTKKNKFRSTKDEKGRFTGSTKETGDVQKDELSASIQNRIDAIKDNTVEGFSAKEDLRQLQERLVNVKVSEIPKIKADSARIADDYIQFKAKKIRPVIEKEKKVAYYKQIAKDSDNIYDFQINVKRLGQDPMSVFKGRAAMEKFYRENSGAKYRKAEPDEELLKQARKYGSEEEFVRAQIKRDFVSEVEPVSLKATDRTAFTRPASSRAKSRELTDRLVEAAKRNQKQFDRDIQKTIPQLQKEVDGLRVFAEKEGASEGSLGIALKEEIIKTKSQLTDLWKKAQGKFRLSDDFDRIAGLKITPEQEAKIIALNKKLFGDEDIKITAQLLTPEGQKAFGEYKNKVIKILDGQADPVDTFYHEAVHKYLDLFTTLDEQKKIYVEARKVWKTDNLDELEEQIAENFIRYAKTSEGVTGTLKEMFDKVLNRIRAALKGESQIEALYKDILEGKASKTNDEKFLLPAKEARRTENEILSDLRKKELEIKRVEKAVFDEEKYLKSDKASDFIFDYEIQSQYQSFKDLLRKFGRGKGRDILMGGDSMEIKKYLGTKVAPEEIDNILYSRDKSEDEMLDYFRDIFERDRVKIMQEEIKSSVRKRLESDPDYAKLQDELEAIKQRKISLEKEESLTREVVNKRLQEEVVNDTTLGVVQGSGTKKKSLIGSRLNKALPEDFKLDDTYDQKVIKDEVEKAAQLIYTDKENAIKKALDPNTNPMERDAIFIELSEIAKRDGDWATVADLFQKRSELIRGGAQALNMEKASILLNSEEKYMRDIVNARLGQVKVSKSELTITDKIKGIRKVVRKEIDEVTKTAFKVKDAQEIFEKLTC